MARFIGGVDSREIVFAKNVTEAINLVAYTWGRANLHEGDAILLTELEHRIARHPKTTFISVHFGNCAEDIDRVAGMLRQALT